MRVEEYRETIDYSWVLARQIDRILSTRSHIVKSPRLEFEHRISMYKAAIIALYYALPPTVRSHIENPVHLNDLHSIDMWFASAIAAIERSGLLIRKRVVEEGLDEIEHVEHSI